MIPDAERAVDELRAIIARVVATLEVWDTLDTVRNALGLPYEDREKLGKEKYLRKLTAAASDNTVISAARQMLNAYPGTREKPSAIDLQNIQDNLWWIESGSVQHISRVTRYKIAESLDSVRFWGRLRLAEFFAPVLPGTAYQLPFYLSDDGYLHKGRDISMLDFFGSGLPTVAAPPSPTSVAECLRSAGFGDWPDQRFCLFVERVVHPEVQPPDRQQELVTVLSEILQNDDFELREEGRQGGIPVYKVRKRTSGVLGPPKYIIFASSGPKPDIVIDDVVNMDIRIVRHADRCLIYDQPPPNGDLTWEMLVEWWSKVKGTSPSNQDIRRDLGQRLRASLQSDPERYLFDTYFRAFRPKLGGDLPALLPQVYLHYDPRTQSERGSPVLVRQRMDFLMLLRNAVRIVIEVDGVQHYADDNGRALPSRYAEMVAEDRRVKTLGYEVYRFGGAEFMVREHASQIIINFFDELFARYGVWSGLKTLG